MTLEELRADYDWACVFADDGNGSCGNCSKELDLVGEVSDAAFTREDVVEVLASRDGEHDGPAWMGVFRLNDGRFVYAEGSCDYTGWD